MDFSENIKFNQIHMSANCPFKRMLNPHSQREHWCRLGVSVAWTVGVGCNMGFVGVWYGLYMQEFC